MRTSTKRDVFVEVPADSAYVAVLRTTTAGLAARLDFTIDDIEDLRIAVGEACATVLEQADPQGRLECSFLLDEGRIQVTVAAESAQGSAPSEEGFSWQVLSALADDVRGEYDDGLVRIVLAKRSGVLA